MRRLAALALLLCLTPGAKSWSEKHGLGVTLPQRWTLVQRDDGPRAFIVEGPLLGDGKPRLVLWNLGPLGDRSLEAWTKSFDKQLRGRAGWKRTAMVHHEVGPWRAMRLGYAFQEPGKAKGRARVSIVLYGTNVLVLEMSGASRGFPAATFDRVEKSIELKWSFEKLSGGAKVPVPPGWRARPMSEGMRVDGPRGSVVMFQRGGAPPPGVEKKGTLRFLGKKREVQTATREVEGRAVQLRYVQHRGWSAAILMPVDAWEEIGPCAREVLGRFELPPLRDGKKD